MYRTVQELGIREFREQSSTKFIELFIINIELQIIFPECYAFYIGKFCKFCRNLSRKFLYPQLLGSSINFTKLFFSVQFSKKGEGTPIWKFCGEYDCKPLNINLISDLMKYFSLQAVYIRA